MNRRTLFARLATLLVGLLVVGVAWAASPAGYDLSWWTADGGGATLSSGGGFALSDTIGQPDAGLMRGGGYTLGGGFWGGGEVFIGYEVYLPLMLR
jgi:hypothetical protein